MRSLNLTSPPPGGDGSEPMASFAWHPKQAPALTAESSAGSLLCWPMRATLRYARLVADASALQEILLCYARCKPFLNSKLAAPTTVPAVREGAGACNAELWPVEAVLGEMVHCEVLEPFNQSTMCQERRWPYCARIPNIVVHSHSLLWDLKELLNQWAGACRRRPSSDSLTGPADGSGEDVTLPKEMFDKLVQRAAEATFKESQFLASREELQKAYIALADQRLRSTSSGVQGTGAASQWPMLPGIATLNNALGLEPLEKPLADDASEVERWRRKCAQLESSVQSQVLTQRRLETELAQYQALARTELQQLLRAKALRPVKIGT